MSRHRARCGVGGGVFLALLGWVLGFWVGHTFTAFDEEVLVACAQAGEYGRDYVDLREGGFPHGSPAVNRARMRLDRTLAECKG